MSTGLRLMQAGTYAWKIASFPQNGSTDGQKVLEVGHGSDCVEQEA